MIQHYNCKKHNNHNNIQLLISFTNSRDLSGSEWINKEQIENILVEVIRDIEYNNFVAAMDRLASHPYSYRVREFVEKYRKPLMSQTTTLDIPKLQVDKDGRDFITVYGK